MNRFACDVCNTRHHTRLLTARFTSPFNDLQTSRVHRARVDKLLIGGGQSATVRLG